MGDRSLCTVHGGALQRTGTVPTRTLPDRRGDIGIVENITSMHGERLPCKGEIYFSWPRMRLPTCIEDYGALPSWGT